MLECLTGSPASQQLHGAGPLPAEEEGGSQLQGSGGTPGPFLAGLQGFSAACLRHHVPCKAQGFGPGL